MTVKAFIIRKRLFVLVVVVFLFMFFLAFGLWNLQIRQASKFVRLALTNRVRYLRELGARGIIYDRNGLPLAVNVGTFALQGYPLELKKPQIKKEIISFLIKNGYPITPDEYDLRIKKQYISPYHAVVIFENITLAQLSELISQFDFPPQLFPKLVLKRIYPVGRLLSHVVGYVGEISLEELRALQNKGYEGGDDIGKSGIEKFYESVLRGGVGGEEIEVDAVGRKVRSLSYRPGAPGKSLTLTIDLVIQRFVDTALGENRGVALVMDPKSGEILAYVVHPSYDPNPLSWGVSPQEWKALIRHPLKPMLNRAIAGAYPPGSIFKPIVALGALQEGVITPKTRFLCTGKFKLGNRTFRCWLEWGHGNVDLLDAIKFSCDIYFYNVGLLMGVNKIVKYSKMFGLGEKTGIDLPGEKSGLLPTPRWKKKVFKDRWYKGDTVNLSIGQGFLLVTPIQMLRAYAAIANGGYLVTPHLVVNGVFSNRKIKLPINQRYIRLINNDLVAVVDGGTGRRASVKGVKVAGKTGTAQNPHGEDHAWFVCYAPADDPKYVVLVFVEQGGHGSQKAAPIAGEILKFLLNSRN